MKDPVAYNTLKAKIYSLVEAEGKNDWFDRFIICLVLLNVFAVALETVETIGLRYHLIFHYFEFFSIACFTAEYILRIWACNSNPTYNTKWGRLKFAIRPLVIIDLLSVLPFFLHFKIVDLRHLQMFKMVRYSRSVRHIVKIIRSQAQALISGVILIAMLMIVSGSLLYYMEHEAQPKVFSSIPAAMWWSIVTITTLGYGDMFPITILGKVGAALTAICGIGLFALPAGVMGAAFLEHMKEEHEKDNEKKHPPNYCYNCGERVN